MLGNQFGIFGIEQLAHAQAEISMPTLTVPSEDHDELGLIAILAENSLLQDVVLRGHIFQYAENAQSRIPHSQAFVIGIDKNESTFKIATILEKLYYEGIDTNALDTNPLNNNSEKKDDNRLAGVVVVGDVPIPVVYEGDGTSHPSVYPYTDFYRKRYIYNYGSDKFEYNGEVASPTPEVWHGVIVPPSKTTSEAKSQLIEFFEKNNAYSNGDPEFADFEKRMMYANFPAMEKQMNFMDYRNYERYGKYMEEMAFHRYNKYLLKEVVKEVSTDMGSEEQIIPEEAIDSMFDVYTDYLIKKYTAPLSQALKIYRGKLNDAVKKTGRWKSSQVDTPDSLVSMRDEYAKYDLRKKQTLLESKINKVFEDSVPEPLRILTLPTDAKLKVKLKILDIDADTTHFTFHGFIDGKEASEIESANECGMYTGQERKENESVLQNNSIFVEANRMYDPESNIKPPDDDDDWELEETQKYKDYAGCVFNNSIKIDVDDPSLHLGPYKCNSDEAVKPLFNIIGSNEVDDKSNGAGKCSFEYMSFLPAVSSSDSLLGGDAIDNKFNDLAAGAEVAGVEFGKNLGEVINDVYGKLRNDGTIANPEYTMRSKASAVVKALVETGRTIKYSPASTVDIEVSAEQTDVKLIDSFVKHTEPTNETIKAIKHIGEPRVTSSGEIKFPQITTPSMPSDGIHYFEFAKLGEKQKYVYPNIYRVGGVSPTEATSNLLQMIQSKESELSVQIGVTTNVISKFIYDNADTIEPIIWRTMGVDQKLENIIPKYLDKGGLMPTPDLEPARSPQNKPNGYEVLQIVANGDAFGYQFGLNRAMKPAPAVPAMRTVSMGGDEGGGGGEGDGEDEGGGGGGDDNYLCGDPSGVEIWEWFDALQCWIEEEILPASELLKLDDSCGAMTPVEEQTEEELLPDPMDTTTSTVAQIDVKMERKSLVTGEETVIGIYPLNSDGETIFGYIKDPVHLEFSDANMGEFDKNDFNVYTGEAEVTLKTLKAGSTSLNIKMGDENSVSIPIHIYDSIGVKWTDSQFKDGVKTKFKINVALVDPDGKPINDVNTDIILGPLKPSDGGFENSGKVQLLAGKGETIFVPTPGPEEVKLIEKDPYYSSEPYTITPPPNQPVKLVVMPPKYIKVGETVDIPVVAADIYGMPARTFASPVSVKLEDTTKKYATILTPNVPMANGKGTIRIKAGKDTGDIQLIAEYGDLQKGIENVPVLARMESDEWKDIYPQNLFASFVGFPAGNFLEEDYFGGVHLFSGKTEAVFSFMKSATPAPEIVINPNYKVSVTAPYQKVYVEFPGSNMLLQAFDQKNMVTLFSKTIPLNFDEAVMWTKDTQLTKGKVYVDLQSDSYKLGTGRGGAIKISDAFGKTILEVAKNRINLPDPKFKLVYSTEPEFDLVELILTDDFEEVGRIMLNFVPVTLNESDFDEISPMHTAEKIYSGKSTNDPTGLILYNFKTEAESENLGEYFGLEGDNKYLQLFAAGSSIGESVQYNLPANAILLGDPTIKLQTKASGGLDYDNSSGRKIFQDIEKTPIISINNFNFNNDGYEDVVLIMKDGRVRLLEGAPTDPMFKDRGDIAFLADGAVAVEKFDFNNDGYEDILVGTEEGRLAILENDGEVLTRSDQQIKIGKKLYTLLRGDMDADGFDDLVTLDSRGDIKIFYNENNQFSENGKLIGNYGFSLKLDQNLYKDLDVRYPGLNPPSAGTVEGVDTSALPKVNLPTPAVEASSSQQNGLEGFLDGDVSEPSESKSNALYEAAMKMAEAAREDPAAFAQTGGGEVPLLPWPEENETETKSDDEIETYFAPAEDVSFLTITKTVSNKERPRAVNLDLEENLIYEIRVTSGISKNNVVIADTVPDSLSVVKDSAKCEGTGCGDFKSEQKDIRFFFDGLNLRAGQTITITYEASVKNTPKATVFIQKLTTPIYVNDRYLDLVVSPAYNNTGDVIQHYTVGPREYSVRSTSSDTKPMTEGASVASDALKTMEDFGTALTEFGLKEDQTDMKSVKLPEGMGGSLDEATGNNDCFDDASSVSGCAGQALDAIANVINAFACMGGGCFPIPWNFTFLVPPQMPLPVFAFPAGPGPYPIPGFLAMPGAAAVPGTYSSMIRFYLGFSLTGGMGIAMCWGPYMGSSTAPTPVFPIPYPPPVGNCMVTALPPSALPWGSVCGWLEEKMNQLMGWINSGINKINSAAASVNNNDNLPAGLSASNSEGGAGGLEVSLGVNLGESMKFEPPAKGFSNIHIPAFDSLGGVIADWFDRQVLEITTKLLTLPSFYIYLPDIKSLFSLDAATAKKKLDIWIENMSKSAQSTGETLDGIRKSSSSGGGGGGGDEADNFNEGMEAMFDTLQTGLQTGKSSKALKYMGAIEKQGQIFNLNALQGLYDTVNALPLVNLTEKDIEFKVPWISSGEVQAYIMELQRWLLYYEREFERVRDKWEKLTCSAGATDNPLKSAANCAASQIAEMFTLDFDKTLESVQTNIAVLQSYLTFPRKFIVFKQQLADYVKGVACYMDVIANMFGGWYARLQEQIISWAELILTIYEIIKNWKDLFDLFIDFDTSCSICTNERYANFGWWMLLGLILPEIPIISFPKWPDIVLDLSDLKAGINIELPMLHITPVSLPLPPLPYIRLPDFPNISLLFQLPALPILPALPEMPELPPLPPIPTVDLPTLPAPPKLPDIGISLEIIIKIIEQILNVWCLLKKALAPVPESMLNDQITLLTNRPAYLIPLDILKLQLPNIALFDLGFNELRIETVVYLGLRIQIVSQIMETKADEWNTFIENIPKEMKKWYAEKLEESYQAAQSKIDGFEQMMDEGVSGLQDDIQKKLDDATKQMEEDMSDAEKYFRDKEKEWQDWANDHAPDWTYDEYVKAINEANKAIDEKSQEWKDKLDTFFDEYRDFIHALNYLVPLAGLLEQLDKYNADEVLQEVIFDNIGKGLDAALSGGPAALDELMNYLRACFDDKDECDNDEDYFGYKTDDNKLALESEPQSEPREAEPQSEPQSNQLKKLFEDLVATADKMKNAPLVDYKKVKEELGVADFDFPEKKNSADKINWMKDKLMAYSDELSKEAESMKNVKDLYALAEFAPKTALPYELASEDNQPIYENSEEKVFTSAIIPESATTESKNELAESIQSKQVEIEAKMEREMKATTTTTTSGEEDYCQGMCLPNPETGQPTAFIPSIDNTILSETLFLDSGHVVYSDGDSLYLKRNLTKAEPATNLGKDVPNKIYRLDEDFLSQLGQYPYLMEAVNMMKTTLNQDGSSSFTWKDSTNPNRYGYGIEMERSVLGFDADKQENNLPDVKFVLLPATTNGYPPEVLVDGAPVEFGTLITSMDNEEAAIAKFGVDADKIVTSAKKVKFTTINNVTISLSDNTAVYFDQYTGPSYSINMENGFYHIKMTWFDEDGRVSTYNHNELLSPQVYVTAAPPVDIAFDKIFYVPVYKEKVIKAGDIFVDMTRAYKYYWYVDVEKNPMTPITGKILTLPPQNEPKEFMVKLLATQNIRDPEFQKYEKTFKVIVYVPKVYLDTPAMQEGKVKGVLEKLKEAPADDLSDIPFSLFRKRWDTWKNLGLLIKGKGMATTPPLNDNEGKKYVYQDSYYTLDSEGAYNITGFNVADPSPVLIKDKNAQLIAKILPGTGHIVLLNENYYLDPLSATTDLPTRIAIKAKETGAVAGNVYYVADVNTDVSVQSKELTMDNISDIGVTVGDADTTDDIIAKNIPGSAKSYPGGVAIYNLTPPQKNIALVDTNGSIRFMRAGYKLKLKNDNGENNPYIFQIVNKNDQPVFDIYIKSNFDNLLINQDKVMEDSGVQIGLEESADRSFASLIAQTPSIPKPAATENPFPDLSSNHPYFSQILELYKRRVISGYGDGTFKPDAKITRAEFIKIALGVTNCYDCTMPTEPQKQKYMPVIPFPDVRLPAWYYYCIWIAKDLAMITGYGDGLFRPERNISRAEAAAVLLRQSQIEIEKAPDGAYADVMDYAWYKDYVYTAVKIGLIKETGGYIFPDEQITRGEFAFMGMGVVNMLDCHEVDEDGDGMPDWWEVANNLDPMYAGDAASDYDFDGFTALQEYINKTDPNKADSDDDGIVDSKDETPIGEAIEAPGEECPCINNPNQNDTDSDKVIDVCDTDIDNDTVENAMCVFDDSGILDNAKVEESDDNCIFLENTDQTDSDMNGVGDACEEMDECPTVPEDMDGVEDEDGCPEVDDNVPDELPGSYVTKGPDCGFLDYEADLAQGDIIMTAITDVVTHDVIYEASNEVIYQPSK